jgi:phage protein U
MALGSWGELPFEVRADKVQTWTNTRRESEARWAKLDVFNAKPVREFIGPDVEKLSISITLDSTRGVDVDAVLKYLREQRDTGEVHTLFFGDDVVFKCSITSIAEDQRRFNQKGKLIFCVVDVTFEEYV